MKISELFNRAKSHVKVYGSPIYQLLEVIGEVNSRDYKLDEIDGTIAIEYESNTIYIQILPTVVSRGIEETQSFTIAKYVATRSESGVFNGNQFVIHEGHIKLFAY